MPVLRGGPIHATDMPWPMPLPRGEEDASGWSSSSNAFRHRRALLSRAYPTSSRHDYAFIRPVASCGRLSTSVMWCVGRSSDADDLHAERTEPAPSSRRDRTKTAGECAPLKRRQDARHRRPRKHVRVVECGDHQRVRRGVGQGDVDGGRLAEVDGIDRHLGGDAEGRARRDRRKSRSHDLAEHRDLRGGDVHDVPQQIRRNARPRLIGASPFLVQRPNPVELLPDGCELCRSRRWRHRFALNRRGLEQAIAPTALLPAQRGVFPSIHSPRSIGKFSGS